MATQTIRVRARQTSESRIHQGMGGGQRTPDFLPGTATFYFDEWRLFFLAVLRAGAKADAPTDSPVCQLYDRSPGLWPPCLPARFTTMDELPTASESQRRLHCGVSHVVDLPQGSISEADDIDIAMYQGLQSHLAGLPPLFCGAW